MCRRKEMTGRTSIYAERVWRSRILSYFAYKKNKNIGRGAGTEQIFSGMENRMEYNP